MNHSYYAYLGGGITNYLESQTDNGKVNIIQKGRNYYYLTHASSINSVIKYHEIKSIEIYDKIEKLIKMHWIVCNSIIKNNIMPEGPCIVLFLNENCLAINLNGVELSVADYMIRTEVDRYVRRFIHGYVSEEVFTRIHHMTLEVSKQIDNIWETI